MTYLTDVTLYKVITFQTCLENSSILCGGCMARAFNALLSVLQMMK